MKTCNKWLRLMQLFIVFFIAGNATAQLKADFSAIVVTGCPPLIVNFQDQSTGNPTSWKWDLGNGTQSVVANPIGTYFDPGTYTVRLVVKNDSGEDSVVKTQFIIVHALPSPKFSASDTAGCFPLQVQFTDSSLAGSGNISSWQWDFGDGNLSNLQNPVHTYSTAGSFTVTLRVVNSNGCSKVLTRAAHIKTFDGVKAGFTYVAGTTCTPPTPITFTNTSTGTGSLSYLWHFGDGNTSTQANPVHQYTAVGQYSVKLVVTSTNGCVDSVVKSNVINIGTVKANFNLPDSICAGVAASFTNTSIPAAVSALWSFSDGTTATGNSPKKAFAAPGVYQVKLVADFGACKDSLTKTITVLAKPAAGFTADNTSSCRTPFTVNFTNTSAGAVSYQWNFGDGKTSTAANPTHNYTAGGKFTVTLIARNASGCTDTLKQTEYIQVTPPRITSLRNLNVRGCLPYTVTPVANVNSAHPIVGYQWYFGDGSTSTDAAPTYTYTTPGRFNVKLVVYTATGCKDSVTMNSAVTVGEKPIASFTASPREVCAYLPVKFEDSSTGNPIQSWFWDFGDGGTSNRQFPEHQFGDTGVHDITLVVESFGCADTLIVPKYIKVLPPIANFKDSMNCTEPYTRHFIDKAIGATSYQWDFGDGNTSILPAPVHTYAAPGTYTVKLTVTNGMCEHIKEKEIVIVDENGILGVSDSVLCRNADVAFEVKQLNANNIAGYKWFFDGLTGASVNGGTPTTLHSYSNAGSFSAAVEVTDVLGCKDTLFAPYNMVIYGTKAAFEATPTGACFNTVVNFFDTSITDGVHPVVKWEWSFGDSTAIAFTAPPFTHTYTENGTYDIKLLVEDSYGCRDSITKPVYITISKPVAGFTISDSSKCPSSLVQFTNTSTGGYDVNYSWNFGDGNTSAEVNPSHIYTEQGTYTVKLLMTDRYGCMDSAQHIIHIYNPVADFALSDTFSSCPPLLVNFTNQSAHFSQVHWDFGDGGNSQLDTPARMYTYPGIYRVKLSVTNNGGCTDTISKQIVIQGPTGVFNYAPATICTGGAVTFEVNTQNTTQYIWDFNDGYTVFNTSSSATHHYATTGKYVPKVILEDAAGCRVPIIGNDTITVLGVETYIKAQPRVLCDSGMVHFTDSTISNDAIATYAWNFGDGNTSVDRSPSNQYSAPGWYNVTLITTSQFGCADTVTYNRMIKVAQSPRIAILGDTAACEPATLTFSGDRLPADTGTFAWSWVWGNGNTALVQNPAAQAYPAAGSFPVSLTATSYDGCVTTISTTALIHPKPLVNAGLDTIICRFESYTLQATGANQYAWQNDITLSCTDCPTPVATPTANHTYYVRGTSEFGCVNYDTVHIKVKQPFKITYGKNDSLCIGQSQQLFANGAELYNWTPARWLDNSTSANPNARPDSTVTYKVVGSDDHNCFTDSGFVTITVFPIPKVEILNGDEISLLVGHNIKLNTKSSPDVTSWRWMPAQGLSCSDCPEPIAAPKQDITYTLYGSNDGSCMSRDQVHVKVICENANVFLPNTFSPNGDGMNDVFYPRGKGLFNIKSMRIFNRWGNVVFERTNITPNNAAHGWDGTLNGVKMQPDVYVYIVEAICDNSTIVPIKGNVTLLR